MTTSIIIAIAVALLFSFAFRLFSSHGKADDTRSARLDDVGQILMLFGQAFPALPIRDAVLTSDRRAGFVRLADGRAGFVQMAGNRSICRVLDAGAVTMRPGDDTAALHLTFRDQRIRDGAFVFESAQDAAEVALWLMGTLATAQKAERNEPQRLPE